MQGDTRSMPAWRFALGPEVRILLSGFRTRWRRSIAVVIGSLVLGTAVASLLPVRWVSSATFLPQAKRNSDLAGLAATLGVVVAGQEAGSSPTFFAQLIRSRAVIDRVVMRKLPRELGGSTVATYLFPNAKDSVAQTRSARLAVQKMIDVNTLRSTGVIELTVATRPRALSLFLASAVLEELDQFNVVQRRSRARSEYDFSIAMRDSAAVELRRSEAALLQFVRQNRQFRDSPELSQVFDTLSRRVGFAQSQYSSLLVAAEQARLEEVRDTPVIAIIEVPEAPVAPDRRLQKAVIGVFVLIGMSLAVFPSFREVARGMREGVTATDDLLRGVS